MSGVVLAARNVSVRFGGLVAVDDVDIEVPSGTVVGLVGPNGAGKTTLFGVLSGLLRPAKGTVELLGRDVTNLSPQARARLGMARTFQHLELFHDLTVRQHVVLAYRVHHAYKRLWRDLIDLGGFRRPPRDEDERVDGLVSLLGLDSVADVPVAALPLGTNRRVEVARALAASTAVLLLDEPSSGLDPRETEQLSHVLRTIVDTEGVGVLLVEHDVGMVLRLSSMVTVLDFGRCIAVGTPDEIRANEQVKAAYLGDAGETNGSAGVTDTATTDSQPEAGPVADVLLEVENLEVSYALARALFGVSFTARCRQLVAILGPNGAGKSTLARAVSGLVPSTAGRILLDGNDITRWPPHKIRQAGLVHIPEGRGIFPGLSVAENLRMAVRRVGTNEERRAGIEGAYELFPALGRRRSLRAASLSGGEQQMLAMARALAVPPKLIVADEMSLGLAPIVVDEVFHRIDQAKRQGVTFVLIEQFVHRALALADTCIILSQGQVTWSGPAADAKHEALDRYLGDAM